MAGNQFDVKSITGAGDVQVKTGRGKIIGVYVTRAGTAGTADLILRDGTDATGTIILNVDGGTVQRISPVNRMFTVGLFADVDVTGNAEYLIVFE